MISFFGERIIIGGFIIILFFILLLKLFAKKLLTKENQIIMKFLSDLGLFIGGIAVFYTYLKDSLQRSDETAEAAREQDLNYSDTLKYLGENKDKIPIVYDWVINGVNSKNDQNATYLNDEEKLALEYVNSKFFQSWLSLIKLVNNDSDIFDSISDYKQLIGFWKKKERHPLAERFANFYAVEDNYQYLQENAMYYPKQFLIYIDASIIEFQKSNIPRSLRRKYNLH
jgi:hypothetical protein